MQTLTMRIEGTFILKMHTIECYINCVAFNNLRSIHVSLLGILSWRLKNIFKNGWWIWKVWKIGKCNSSEDFTSFGSNCTSFILSPSWRGLTLSNKYLFSVCNCSSWSHTFTYAQALIDTFEQMFELITINL